jgi:hypothetical protein
MQTIIQLIETQWTKASRGHPGADARNRVPDFFPFPQNVPRGDALFQHVVYAERTSFLEAASAPVTVFSKAHSDTWRIDIARLETGIDISFFGVPSSGTSGRPVSVSRLANNAWLRIVGNRRISEEWGWTYRKYIYNVFHGDARDANDVVTGSRPMHLLDHRGILW